MFLLWLSILVQVLGIMLTLTGKTSVTQVFDSKSQQFRVVLTAAICVLAIRTHLPAESVFSIPILPKCYSRVTQLSVGHDSRNYCCASLPHPFFSFIELNTSHFHLLPFSVSFPHIFQAVQTWVWLCHFLCLSVDLCFFHNTNKNCITNTHPIFSPNLTRSTQLHVVQ